MDRSSTTMFKSSNCLRKFGKNVIDEKKAKQLYIKTAKNVQAVEIGGNEL